MPTLNSPSTSTRRRIPNGYNTNNSNTNYNMVNAVSQLKQAIENKKINLVEIILPKIPKNELKNTTFELNFKYSAGYFENRRDPLIPRIVTKNYSEGTWTSTKANVLHIAAMLGYTSIVRKILTYHPTMINTKTDDEASFTALQFAALFSNTKTSQFLIDSGASLKGALIAASTFAYTPSTELVRILIDKGANVNDKNVFNGTTPLSCILDTEIIRLLIRRGANVNHRDQYGWTPIMLHAGVVMSYSHELENSRFGRHIDVINCLVQNNASLTYKGRNRDARERERGITLLHIAGFAGMDINKMTIFDHVVQLYKDRNMSLNPKTSLGNTPPLYLLDQMIETLPVNDRDEQSYYLMKSLKHMESKGLNFKIKNPSNLNVRDILRIKVLNYDLSHNVKQSVQEFINFEEQPRTQKKMKNLYIPSNLNTMDPVLLNHVNKNNAYIIKTDLVNKNVTTRGKTRRVREVKTVYNKSSLNGMIQSGRTLKSPWTGRNFQPSDIIKLTDIAPASQLKKYKKNTNGPSTSRG